jgi:hypothetical protein
MQVQDWDEEEEEEEELIKVQQEIERLQQEQESIMRRQTIAQRTEAYMKHINREWARLTELQYTVDILHQQEQRQEPPLVQRQHQLNITLPRPPPHIPLPPLQFNNIPHYQPPSPPHNQFFYPPPPPLPQLDNTNPKTTDQSFATCTMVFPLLSHTTTKVPWKHRPPQIPHVL